MEFREERLLQFIQEMEEKTNTFSTRFDKIVKETNKKNVLLIRKLKDGIRKGDIKNVLDNYHESKMSLAEYSKIIEPANESVQPRTVKKRQAAQKASEKTAEVLKIKLNSKIRQPTPTVDIDEGVKHRYSASSPESERRVKSQCIDEDFCDTKTRNKKMKNVHNNEEVTVTNTAEVSRNITNENIVLTVKKRNVENKQKTLNVRTSNDIFATPNCIEHKESENTVSVEAEIIHSNEIHQDAKPTCYSPKLVLEKLSLNTINLYSGNEATISNSKNSKEKSNGNKDNAIIKPTDNATSVTNSNNKKENTKNEVFPVINGFLSEKTRKGTPLATNNRICTPYEGLKLISTRAIKTKTEIVKHASEEGEKKKREEILKRMQKETEALKKREERLKATTEESRRKREEKVKKVAAQREATEKGKTEMLVRLEKEREEKEALMKAEKQRKIEEQIMKKREMHKTKAQEAEERRMKEENARLREQEEEQKKLAEIRLKQQMEAEKLHQQRQLDEQRTKIAQEKMMEKTKQKLKVSPVLYDLTPPRSEREVQPSKNEEDYGIEDATHDDSSDDEKHPKKCIPTWATKSSRSIPLMKQAFIPIETQMEFMHCQNVTPDLKDIFGEYNTNRLRTSSAIWSHPLL